MDNNQSHLEAQNLHATSEFNWVYINILELSLSENSGIEFE
jgi:hypothetical protein